MTKYNEVNCVNKKSFGVEHRSHRDGIVVCGEARHESRAHDHESEHDDVAVDKGICFRDEFKQSLG